MFLQKIIYMKFLAFDRPLLRSANESVMPFYILHQTVLLCIAYFVMIWEINDAVRWVVLFLSSFFVIITLYMLFIRKFEVLRFLFGIKTTRPFFWCLSPKVSLDCTACPVCRIDRFCGQ